MNNTLINEIVQSLDRKGYWIKGNQHQVWEFIRCSMNGQHSYSLSDFNVLGYFTPMKFEEINDEILNLSNEKVPEHFNKQLRSISHYSEFMQCYMIFLEYLFFMSFEPDEITKDCYKPEELFIPYFKNSIEFPINIAITKKTISTVDLKSKQVIETEFFKFNEKVVSQFPESFYSRFLKLYTDFANKLSLHQY